MIEKRGKNPNGEYTDYQINQKRHIVVQRSPGNKIWFIYDIMRGPGGRVQTVGHDVQRGRAEQQAKAYIQGLKRAGVVVK